MGRLSSGARRRVVALDELRGLCLALMIIYHCLYDLTFMFGVPIPFYSMPLNLLQLFICCNFIFLSGISSRFSKNNVRRGVIVFAVAMGMTAFTWRLMPEQIVTFGVLHFLGICMIMHGIMYYRGKAEVISGFWGLVFCLILFGIFWGIPNGYIGFFGFEIFTLPRVMYSRIYTFFLGFPHVGFRSSDYFPLLPWAFLFFAGSFAGLAFREGNAPKFFYRSRCEFLGTIGRRTLIIYILHQPVLYGMLSVIFLLLGE